MHELTVELTQLQPLKNQSVVERLLVCMYLPTSVHPLTLLQVDVMSQNILTRCPPASMTSHWFVTIPAARASLHDAKVP
jgi:hypothetical protein